MPCPVRASGTAAGTCISQLVRLSQTLRTVRSSRLVCSVQIVWIVRLSSPFHHLRLSPLPADTVGGAGRSGRCSPCVTSNVDLRIQVGGELPEYLGHVRIGRVRQQRDVFVECVLDVGPLAQSPPGTSSNALLIHSTMSWAYFFRTSMLLITTPRPMIPIS